MILENKKKSEQLIRRIYVLLVSSENYRDSDYNLVTKIQSEDLISHGLDPESISLKDFYEKLRSGLVNNLDTITRLRRLCNQKYPNTIGLSYKPLKQETVKETLKSL